VPDSAASEKIPGERKACPRKRNRWTLGIRAEEKASFRAARHAHGTRRAFALASIFFSNRKQ